MKRRRNPEHLLAGLKECFMCDGLLPLDHFAPTARGYAGRAAYCRPCFSKRMMRDPEAHALRARKYRRDNEYWRRMHSRHMDRRRRLIIAQSTGTVTPSFVRSIYDTSTCHYCGVDTIEERRTMDHKTPVSRGGLHDAANIVMACWSCNSSKQDLTEEEYLGLRRANCG